jgi:hypothetical protein
MNSPYVRGGVKGYTKGTQLKYCADVARLVAGICVECVKMMFRFGAEGKI